MSPACRTAEQFYIQKVSSLNPLMQPTEEFAEPVTECFGRPWQQEEVFTCLKLHQTEIQEEKMDSITPGNRFVLTSKLQMGWLICASAVSFLLVLCSIPTFAGEVFFFWQRCLPLVQSQALFPPSNLDSNPSIFFLPQASKHVYKKLRT